jgi:2-polyprenyl-6-methoxyphenol hydroxylase-like FAD-dependent oxidoreductase
MRIAIVGTGISGTTLALRLQQLGAETTLFTDKSPDEMRGGRLPNTVARFEHTIARERRLGVDYWSRTDSEMTCIHFRSADPLPLAFTGRAPHPVRAVDFRTMLPAFVEAYESRGG